RHQAAARAPWGRPLAGRGRPRVRAPWTASCFPALRGPHLHAGHGGRLARPRPSCVSPAPADAATNGVGQNAGSIPVYTQHVGQGQPLQLHHADGHGVPGGPACDLARQCVPGPSAVKRRICLGHQAMVLHHACGPCVAPSRDGGRRLHIRSAEKRSGYGCGDAADDDVASVGDGAAPRAP
ncbi:MAG: hypothetical protein AN485_23365, partial [Anabaena sp. MDT14b]